MPRQRSRLLGSGILSLLVACTLALAACNSSSVSGNQSKPSNSTNAETQSPSNSKTSLSKGLDAAITQIR